MTTPLYTRDPVDLAERAALDLAAAMSHVAGDLTVSWAHQQAALTYAREHGWQAAVDRTADLGELIRYQRITAGKECPECGMRAEHDDNGTTARSLRSYCCGACGVHWDADAWDERIETARSAL